MLWVRQTVFHITFGGKGRGLWGKCPSAPTENFPCFQHWYIDEACVRGFVIKHIHTQLLKVPNTNEPTNEWIKVQTDGSLQQCIRSSSDGQITNQIAVQNHKSFDKRYLNHYAKSQIKWHEIKSNPNHLNQIINKIKCQPNDNSSRLYSLCTKCHQCTSGLTVNVSAKYYYRN